MTSWGFLVKRIIQTVITLVIVLILLFIIFRLMPGDPTKFFIKPGLDPDAYHLIAVKYGFEREELAPGNFYKVSSIGASLPGAYGLKLTAFDSTGNAASSYGTYIKSGSLNVNNNTTVGAISISPPPGMNEQINLNLELVCQTTCPAQFQVNITRNGEIFEAMSLPNVGINANVYEYDGSTVATIDQVGNYYVSFETLDGDGNPISNIYGFSINEDPSNLLPFTIGNFQVADTETGTTEFVVSVTSTTDVSSVNLTVHTPQNLDREYNTFRPTRFVLIPVWEQFAIYMKNMLTFDFGDSFVSGRPVWDELSQRIPPTLLLFGSALITSSVIGILLGAIMAWRRGSKTEIGGIVLSLFFYSMPIFWLGLVLLAIFSFQLGWFPLRGMITPGADYSGLEYVADLLWHLALPLTALTINHLAGWLLLMRNSMLEVMGEDYITTAKAKGLSDRKVMYKHAARNAMLPIVTAIALSISGVVIAGGVLTETIFSWPGMGQYLVQSTYAYDFPAVQGAFFLLAIMTIIGNFIADLLYAYLDPRVRLTR